MSNNWDWMDRGYHNETKYWGPKHRRALKKPFNILLINIDH